MTDNSHLPAAVRAQGDKARKVQEAAKAAKAGKSAPPTPTPPPAGEAPKPGVSQPPSPPVEPAPAAPAAPVRPTLEQMEEKYRVLQGKYNAEVPRLLGQLKDAEATARNTKATIDAHLAEIGRLKVELEAAKKAKPAAPAGAEGDDPMAAFSPELGQGVKAAADKAVAAATAPLLEQIDALKASLAVTGTKVDAMTTQAAESAEDRFYREMDGACPQWEALDKYPAFVSWVRTTTEPFSGKTYAALLNEAVEAFDAKRASHFFTDYLAKNPDALQGERTPALPPVAPPAGNGGGGQPPPPAKRTWTRAEIQAAYADKRTGKYTEKEWAALEADFMAASKEGRLR